MFTVAELNYTLRVPPWMFKRKLKDIIVTELNGKLANKVVLNLGLFIYLLDVKKVGEAFIFPGDGAYHVKICFHALVFRPSIQEILVGKIRACSREGIHVSMEFFDDIMIPPRALPHPARFDETEQVWIWEYSSDDRKHDLFMEIGERIRFRVIAATFQDVVPLMPDGTEPLGTGTGSRVPYSILGTINEPGLGLLTWWSEVVP